MLAGDPAALAALDADMHRYVLQGSLVRVKLWARRRPHPLLRRAAAGRSDLPARGGRGGGARGGARSTPRSATSPRPENVYERPFGKLLEVYVGLTSAGGERLLFEAYFRYDAVVTAAEAQWRQYAPPTLAGLLALQLVQIPFAWSLARRLQRQQRDRQRLLQRAVDASQVERRRIAGDLHDGVVQELTGLTYALDAARLGPDGPRRAAASSSAGSRAGCAAAWRTCARCWSRSTRPTSPRRGCPPP